MGDGSQNSNEPQAEGREEKGTSSETNFKWPVGGVPPTTDAKSYPSLLASYGPESQTRTWKEKGETARRLEQEPAREQPWIKLASVVRAGRTPFSDHLAQDFHNSSSVSSITVNL